MLSIAYLGEKLNFYCFCNQQRALGLLQTKVAFQERSRNHIATQEESKLTQYVASGTKSTLL